jgi:ribonuclease III
MRSRCLEMDRRRIIEDQPDPDAMDRIASNQETNQDQARLEGQIGRVFVDRELLLRSLTHRSFVHEHPESSFGNNESMEFLGDSILGFIVSEELFRRFPQAAEGSLSKAKAYLVSAANLYRMAREMDLGYYLRLSSGEDKTGGRKKRALLVDAYEALIAAIYLDGGIEAARQFIRSQFREALEGIDVDRVRYRDFKSTLQERLHLMHLPDPVYLVVEEQGPDHAKTFLVEVSVQGGISARAAGRTKKEAQQVAAQAALDALATTEASPHAREPE